MRASSPLTFRHVAPRLPSAPLAGLGRPNSGRALPLCPGCAPHIRRLHRHLQPGAHQLPLPVPVSTAHQQHAQRFPAWTGRRTGRLGERRLHRPSGSPERVGLAEHSRPDSGLPQPGADFVRLGSVQRVQAGGGARREGGQLQRGRPGADLPAAGVRPLPEAPGGRAAHRLHQAEEAGHHARGVHRGAGARPAGTRRHPTRREPLQAHLQEGLRDAVPGLHQCQVGPHFTHFFIFQENQKTKQKQKEFV